MSRTGSLGRHNDLWYLLSTGCFVEPEVGHNWLPPEGVRVALDASIVAYDAGYRDGNTVPFSPRCADCRRIAKRVLGRRGLDREQIKKLFGQVGAAWTWSSAESDAKRRADDKGEAVVDEYGAAVLRATVEKRQQRRLARQERHEEEQARRPRVPRMV